MSDLLHKTGNHPQKAAIEALLHHCHRRRYPSRSRVFSPGDPSDTLYYIVHGSLSAIIEHEGKSLVLAYLHPGEFIGEIGVFLPAIGGRQLTLQALQPCIIASIGYTRFHHLLNTALREHSAELLLLLGRQIASRLIEARRQAKNLAFLDVSERIFDILQRLCRQPGAITHPNGLQIRVSRQELGRMASCSREVAGKVVKRLAHDGLISAKGMTIVVLGARLAAA